MDEQKYTIQGLNIIRLFTRLIEVLTMQSYGDFLPIPARFFPTRIMLL